MKTNKSASMAFAIFAGIIVGSLIALRANDSIIGLLLGSVVGGLVGYFFVDPRQSVNGLTYSYHKAKTSLAKKLDFAVPQVTPVVSWKDVFKLTANVMAILVVIVSWYALFMVWSAILDSEAKFTLACLLLPVSVIVYVMNNHDLNKEMDKHIFHNWFVCSPIKLIRFIVGGNNRAFIYKCLMCTPPAVVLIITLRIAEVAFGITYVLCGFVMMTFIGLVHLFRFIHSEERVQASAYAVMGTAIMWWIKASVPVIILGAAIGAGLGVITFKLVSVRFLKKT